MKEFVIGIAKKAGNYLLENFKKDDILSKERVLSKEIVIKYDKESDKIIIDTIKKNYSNYSILTEKSGLTDNKFEYL